MNNQRPNAVTVAAILLALFSALNLASTFIPAFSEGVPAVVVYGSVVLSLLGLVAAYGLWGLKRWSMWLTVALSALNIPSAAPGLSFTPTSVLFVGAMVTVAGYALMIVLAVLPLSR